MSNDPITSAVIARLLPASPDEVYDEWLDPDSLIEWMCPRPARCLKVDLDACIGGRLRIDIEEAGRRFYVHGTYTHLDRPERIGFTWSCSTWPNPHHVSYVLITLAPSGPGQTLMTITHTALTSDLIDQHRRGWQLIADQLNDSLDR
jgi:uncharacterized protein YndB with AHSA1/START domain